MNYIIMHVILSVPVPSDIVISPFAIPWSIISSMMKEVSPLGFIFLFGAALSDLPFCIFNGDLTALFNKLLDVFYFCGDDDAPLGPFSRLCLINLIACSLVKQSHIPSHATIMKSCSYFIGTFLISGYDET